MTKLNLALAGTVAAFAIAAFLDFNPLHLFGADASYQSESNADDSPKYVTYQSAIKVTLRKGNYVLSSLTDQNYGSGSRQQVVTFSPKMSDPASLWVVREGNEKPPQDAGKPVPCNSIIRLTHNSSQRNLHSHHMKASLSGQQEISGYGNDGEGDGGDDWVIQCLGNSRFWERGKPFKLLHKATQNFLQCHPKAEFTQRNCGGNCPIMNHLEAFARANIDDNAIFTVTDSGIFLSQ